MNQKLKDDRCQIKGPAEEISVKEAGRRGGCTTRDRHAGTDFYRRIGAMGGRVTKIRYAHLFSEYGKRGGRPRRPSLGENMGDELAEKREDLRSAQTNSSPA